MASPRTSDYFDARSEAARTEFASWQRQIILSLQVGNGAGFAASANQVLHEKTGPDLLVPATLFAIGVAVAFGVMLARARNDWLLYKLRWLRGRLNDAEDDIPETERSLGRTREAAKAFYLKGVGFWGKLAWSLIGCSSACFVAALVVGVGPLFWAEFFGP